MEYTREQLKKDYAAAQSLKGDKAAYAGALKAIFDKMGSADKATFDANDSASILNEWNQYDPASVAASTQAIAQQAATTKAGQLNQGLDILFQGVQMGIGGSQVARAKNAAAQIQRPGLPGVPGSSPQLAQALNNAQLGTINVNDVLRPAQAGIQDAYNSALNQAQVASGGQAGAYQGMANLANLQRMRANLGLAPVAQQAKAQNQEIYNQLLAQKQAETQNQFANRFGNAQVAFDQYDKDAQAIGGLGSVGRTNMLNAGRQLTQSLQGLTPYLTQPNPQQPYVQPQAPDGGAMAMRARPMLRSTMPSPQFLNPELNSFITNAQRENGLRTQGYNSQYLDQMQPVNPALRFKDPNYGY